MGANNSSGWQQTNNNALTSTLPMKNQVIHFHSSATWKIHFDSLKQTNKLVIFILHDFSSNISNKIIFHTSLLLVIARLLLTSQLHGVVLADTWSQLSMTLPLHIQTSSSSRLMWMNLMYEL